MQFNRSHRKSPSFQRLFTIYTVVPFCHFHNYEETNWKLNFNFLFFFHCPSKWNEKSVENFFLLTVFHSIHASHDNLFIIFGSRHLSFLQYSTVTQILRNYDIRKLALITKFLLISGYHRQFYNRTIHIICSGWLSWWLFANIRILSYSYWWDVVWHFLGSSVILFRDEVLGIYNKTK